MKSLDSQNLVYVGVQMPIPYLVKEGISYSYGQPIAFDQGNGKYYLFPFPEENKLAECVELTPEKVLEFRYPFEKLPEEEYTGPKEWEEIIKGVRNPAPYTFENLIARKRSWTNEWLWAKNPVPYMPSALGFILRRDVLNSLRYPDNGDVVWDLFIRGSSRRTVEDVLGDLQVSDFEDGFPLPDREIPPSDIHQSEYLLGFSPLEKVKAFEKKSFEHLSLVAEKFLYGIVNAEGTEVGRDLQQGVLFRFVEEMLSPLYLFANSPHETEHVLLREVVLESYRREDESIEIFKAPLEELQKSMHKRLPESPIFHDVESLRKARDKLEEKLKDPGYFKK